MANVELATAYVNLVSSAGGLGQSITGELDNAGTQADSAGEGAGKKWAAAFAGVLAAGAVVAGVAKGLFEVGATFDDVSDTIRVGTGKSGEALDSLVASAEKVGTQVPVSFEKASEVVSGLSQRLGLTGTTLETVASQYAAAGNILGEDVDIQSTTAAFSAFGIQGDAVTGAMDRLFQVSQATGVGFNDLAGQVQKNAPAVQALGFSFDETAALIGNLDKAGLNSTAVVSSLGKGLVKLAKDGEEPQAAFQRVTGQIGDLVAQGDKAAALDLASGIFGTKGAVQFVAAVESGTIAAGDFGAVAGLTGDTILGAASDTADFAESLQLFKNNALLALKPAGDAVFGGLSAAMAKAGTYAAPLGTALSTALTTGMTKAGELASSLKTTLGGAFTSVSAVVGPALSEAFSSVGPVLTEALGAIGDTFSTVFTALGPVFAQLGPMIAGLLPLLNPVGAILKALIPVLPTLADAFGQIAVAIGGALMTALSAVAPLLPKIGDVIAQVAGILAGALQTAIIAVVPVVTALGEVFAAIVPIVVDLVESILPRIVPVFEQLLPVIASVVESVAGFLVPAIEALLPVVVTVFEAIGPIVQAALDIVTSIIQVVTGIISGDWSMVWDGILGVITGVWDLIKGVIQGALDIVISILAIAWEGITTAANAAWELVKTYIITPLQSAWDFITGVFQGIIGSVGSVWESVKTAASAVLDTLYAIFVEPFQTAWDWVTSTFSRVSAAVGSVWTSVKTAASAVLDTLYAIFIKPFEDAYNWVVTQFEKLVGVVKGIWDRIVSIFTTAITPTLNLEGTGYTATGGSDMLAATGAVVPPRPGGTRFIVGEAGETEVIAPVKMMADTFRDVLNSTTLASSGAGGGGLTGGAPIYITTQDPDVEGALNTLLFQIGAA